MSFPPEAADKLIDAAAASGVGAAELFAGAQVPGRTALSYAQLCALYEAAARLTGDDDFGLHVGENTRPSMYGLLGYATAHSLTLGAALERMVALQPVWTEAVAFEAVEERKRMRLRYRPRDAVSESPRRHENEQMMAALATFLKAAAGRDIAPVEVRFEHAAPADTSEHKRLFQCPILFGATATEMVIARDVLGLPIVAADPVLGELVSAQAETALAARARREPLLDALRDAALVEIKAARPPSLAAAAARLGVGPRTLQRRLAEQGWSWRKLLEQLRIDLARELLGDARIGLAQIAFRTGFSQASAFHRAFRRIAGTTPRRYRLRVLAAQERR